MARDSPADDAKTLWRRPAAVASVLLLAATTFGCAAQDDVRLEGQLTWTSERQTFTPCESADVYQVKTLAPNLHVLLSQRVDNLRATADSPDVLATIAGRLSKERPSDPPPYPIDGVLHLRELLDLRSGKCPD